MKKTLSLILICFLLSSIFSFSGRAYHIGDVVGYALATDIAATINGYDIPSYNVDGYTYIVVEDLRYYGFAVNYDDTTRSLSVCRDFSQSYVSKEYQKPYISPNNVGVREHNLIFTDIITYLDGYYTPSFNINGQTIIRFDALSAYGGVSYDDNKREISAIIPEFAINPHPVDREKARLQLVVGVYEHLQYDNSITISEYDGKNIAFEIISIGQNGNRIAISLVRETVSNGVCYFTFEDSWGNTGNGVLKILNNGKLSLSFYNVNFIGLWGVSCGEGDYYRSGDVPKNYEPIW